VEDDPKFSRQEAFEPQVRYQLLRYKKEACPASSFNAVLWVEIEEQRKEQLIETEYCNMLQSCTCTIRSSTCTLYIFVKHCTCIIQCMYAVEGQILFTDPRYSLYWAVKVIESPPLSNSFWKYNNKNSPISLRIIYCVSNILFWNESNWSSNKRTCGTSTTFVWLELSEICPRRCGWLYLLYQVPAGIGSTYQNSSYRREYPLHFDWPIILVILGCQRNWEPSIVKFWSNNLTPKYIEILTNKLLHSIDPLLLQWNFNVPNNRY
jgi:hypothetical protein